MCYLGGNGLNIAVFAAAGSGSGTANSLIISGCDLILPPYQSKCARRDSCVSPVMGPTPPPAVISGCVLILGDSFPPFPPLTVDSE